MERAGDQWVWYFTFLIFEWDLVSACQPRFLLNFCYRLLLSEEEVEEIVYENFHSNEQIACIMDAEKLTV